MLKVWLISSCPPTLSLKILSACPTLDICFALPHTLLALPSDCRHCSGKSPTCGYVLVAPCFNHILCLLLSTPEFNPKIMLLNVQNWTCNEVHTPWEGHTWPTVDRKWCRNSSSCFRGVVQTVPLLRVSSSDPCHPWAQQFTPDGLLLLLQLILPSSFVCHQLKYLYASPLPKFYFQERIGTKNSIFPPKNVPLTHLC